MFEMQTSKSYATGANNVEIKLELDDLEYVFADGRNLIINHDENGDDADSGSIVYADGAQAVVLQTGVKHYIQTVEGETYLVGNDSENIQQLVINAEDQSEESNSAIEYLQSDENGEAIVYKFAESEHEVCEGQTHPKRFKIGDTEYVTLDNHENFQFSEDNQFSILDEDSITENGSFQYAILKDGKLHLQFCEADSIEVLNDTSEEPPENNDEVVELGENSNEYIVDKNKVHEYVIVNPELSSENTVDVIDISKTSAKNFLSGKAINLDDYLSRIQSKVNHEDKCDNISTKRKYNQFLNKKMLIRKNANGKSLFGRILHIKPAKKVTEEEEELEQTVILDGNTESSNLNEHENNDDETDLQEFMRDMSEYVININNTHVNYNQQVTEEQMNFLSKTLNGLMEMPSLRKKLVNHRLEIKYIEKIVSEETRDIIKDVRFVRGCLLQQNNEFVLDDSGEQKNFTSLTVIVTDDNNQKTTKVTFNEKSITCHSCNRNFKSSSLLNKHIQTYHMDKTLICNVCLIKFNNHVVLNEHRKANGHYFNCGMCNKRFTTQGSLKRHQSVHDQNLKLECVICKARFANVSNLSKHLLTCTYIKAYQCETCGKSFMTYGDLNIHKKIHNPLKMCYCDICGREFSRHSNLLRHAEIHKGDGDLYKCGICECSYKFISSLTRHIVQNHMK